MFPANVPAVVIGQRLAGQAALMRLAARSKVAATVTDPEGPAVACLLPGTQQTGQGGAGGPPFGVVETGAGLPPGIVGRQFELPAAGLAQRQAHDAAVGFVGLPRDPGAFLEDFETLRNGALGKAEVFGECRLRIAVAVGIAQITEDGELDRQQAAADGGLALFVADGAGEGGEELGKRYWIHGVMVANRN